MYPNELNDETARGGTKILDIKHKDGILNALESENDRTCGRCHEPLGVDGKCSNPDCKLYVE